MASDQPNSENLLKDVNHPRDLQKLNSAQLQQLSEHMRERILKVVGRNGGHLASNLGTVELTIALHYCFDFEQDHLVWDVGHQCYAHKMLTGRNDRFDTLRQSGGLSGFPSVNESPFDLFNVGHAGTAIPTALGLAHADLIQKQNHRIVTLVGDASIANGLSFEGINQAGLLKRQFLVILNDNNFGIAPTEGALAQRMAKLRTSAYYEEFKQAAKQYLPKVPLVGQSVADALGHLKESIKATVTPHQIFEQLGFMYLGPVDGHNINHLIEMFKLLAKVNHPVLLHVHTNKGHGADFAIAEPERFHSPQPFEVKNGKVTIKAGKGKSWTTAFADALVDLAGKDSRITALTAGMPAGTGLDKFADVFPQRYQDVGIAESCAVATAAGMAKAGLKPVVAIYSTFMQRAFDQVFHEVALQELPVIFCLDRAGLVGGDGAVHHGFLDISYMRGLQGMVVMAPADERELQSALRFAAGLDRPTCIRYPRDKVPQLPGPVSPFSLGRSQQLRKGNDATILAYGSMVQPALQAADLLAAENIQVRVINARFAKPVDEEMVISALVAGHSVFTVEDHSVSGGFGSAVLETAQNLRLSTDRLVRVGIPADGFIQHGSRCEQLAECGLDASGIAATVRRELAGTTEHSANKETTQRASVNKQHTSRG